MSGPEAGSRASGKALELRRSFDQGFATPASRQELEVEDLLAVRVAAQPYAVRVRDIAGMARGGRITPLPGPLPELLGLVGVRGSLLPVYSLAVLLGHPRTGEASPWLAFCGPEGRVALSMDGFEGFLRVPRSDLVAPLGVDASRPFVKEAVRLQGKARPLIALTGILQEIHARAGRSAPASQAAL